MDELIKQIQDKTGLDTDKIKQVIEQVMSFVGDKLPAPIAGQVKKLLGDDTGDGGGGDEGGSGGMGDLMGKAKDALGGLMGN